MSSQFLIRFVLALYRSTILRILFVLLALLCALYYTLALPWVNRSISKQYQQQTGHTLVHDKIDLHLFQCKLTLNHLKDSADLWQAKSLRVDIGCLESLGERALIVRAVRIQELVLKVQQQDNGLWNFNDIIVHQQAQQIAAGAKKSTGAALVIRKISLENSALNSNLLALNNMPVSLSPLSFSISNIDLRAKHASGFSLTADINKSAQILVEGNLNLASRSGQINVDVHKLPFVWFKDLIKSYANLNILGGTFELNNQLLVNNGVLEKITTSGGARAFPPNVT